MKIIILNVLNVTKERLNFIKGRSTFGRIDSILSVSTLVRIFLFNKYNSFVVSFDLIKGVKGVNP